MLNKNLKAVREELGISQVIMAERLGIAQAQYSTYERGDRKPSAEIFQKFISIFNINVNYLLTGEGPMFITPELSKDILQFKIPKNAKVLLEVED